MPLFRKSDSPTAAPGQHKAAAVNPRLMRQIEEQGKRSFDQGFLHIPKTGGSGIDDMLTRLAEKEVVCPVKFGHGWRMAQILEAYPRISVSFVLRDPLERMVSGFRSRMRMGRPRNNSYWSPGEAISFSYFDNPRDLFLALIGEDERLKSAALFALRHIQHLKYGYRYYFKSVGWLQRHAASIGVVGRIERMEDFLRQFAARAGIEDSLLLGHYAMAHVGDDDRAGDFDEAETDAVRAVLGKEYEIYNYLISLVKS